MQTVDPPVADDAHDPPPAASPLNGCRVSMFENAFGKVPHDTELVNILNAIRNGKWRAQVERLRATLAKDREAYRKDKRLLPGFAMSGTAAGDRKTPNTRTGYLQVDLDHLDERLDAVREQMKADSHVAFGFVSPSAVGLKLGLRIDPERHDASFRAAQAHFMDRYGLEIDPNVKDLLRLCFISYDPDAWVRPEPATPLPAPDVPEQRPILPDGTPLPLSPEPDPEEQDVIILPSAHIGISESAQQIFTRIAPTHTLFIRGGAMVELVVEQGVARLEILKPEAFRSRVEKHGTVVAWRANGPGQVKLKHARLSRDDANSIMASTEARDLLPPVASVLQCPVMIEPEPGQVAVLGKGYHPDQGGLYILRGDTPPQMTLKAATDALSFLIEEFDFQSAGDRSRALAAFLTPALRMGGHLRGNVPIDVAEATESQSGKGYRHSLVCALYGESAYFVTARQGGVGSLDESFASALIAGRPFICLDNFRGRLDSQHLEAFMTCPTLFSARVPYRGEVQVNPRRFLLQMTSNGLEATRDLANRCSICRIRKRPGHNYRDTLGMVEEDPGTFLGAVFSILTEWVARGKPRSQDTRHDFRDWAQALDWIVQNLLGAAPLMDGHQGAQERVSDPALSWLRSLALAADADGRLTQPFIASELVELCHLHDLAIPGLKDPDEDRERKAVGMLMRRIFKATEIVVVDGYFASRATKRQQRPEGGPVELKTYRFSKA